MNERSYILPSSTSESERLERQAGLYGGAGFLDPFLKEDCRDVLDVGSGTGWFSRHAAARLPDCRFVGLDMDASRIEYARARTQMQNVRFVAGDLCSMPFADASFDLVFCRFVLVHAKDPTRAIFEMARVARPGGRVVAYDMVHEGIWFSPEKPAFSKLLRALCEVMRERGMEPSQGLHLAGGMVRAGLRDVRAQVIPHAFLSPDPMLETYRANWIDTISRINELLGAHFDPGLVNDACRELAARVPGEFLVEMTVLAYGTK